MSCTVTVDGPCRRTLNFSIERQVLDREIDSQVQQIARTAHFKGFRKGKVPAAIVRRTHGAALAEDARRAVMGRAFGEAIQEHDLHPVGEPEMNLEALQDDGKGPFTFEFAIEVAPEIELNVADSIPVTIVMPPFEEKHVGFEIERIRKQAAGLEDAEEGVLVSKQDMLEGTAVYVVDGQELEPRTARPALLEHGLVDGMVLGEKAQALHGKLRGDTVELEVELPAHFDPKEHAGKPATLRYTIDRHRLVVLPELDEELLKKLGVESEAQLRERIRQGIEAQRAQFRDRQVDGALERQLLADHPFELPARLIAKNIDHRVHEHAHKLIEEQGLSSEEGHQRAEEKREEIAAASREGLRLAFVLNRLATEHGLTASTEAAEEQVRLMGRQHGQDPESVVETARREGWLADVREQLTQEAVRAWLRRRAEVTEELPEPAPEAVAESSAEAE